MTPWCFVHQGHRGLIPNGNNNNSDLVTTQKREKILTIGMYPSNNPPPFPEAFRIFCGSQAARMTIGYFLTCRVTIPLSNQKWSGTKQCGYGSASGSADYIKDISLVVFEKKIIGTYDNIPPCLCSIWFVEKSLFETTFTVIFLDRIPHMDRHEGFIFDETGNVLPGISILKRKSIDFPIEFRSDFFTLELTMNSDGLMNVCSLERTWTTYFHALYKTASISEYFLRVTGPFPFDHLPVTPASNFAMPVLGMRDVIASSVTSKSSNVRKGAHGRFSG